MLDSKKLAHTVLQLATRPDAEKHLETFITFLQKNNLMGLLPQIVDYVQRISQSEAYNQILHIYSRYTLSDADITHIQKITGAENAPVQQHIDESVIGGFSATYRGCIYDGSLDHQVTRLKDMLTFS